MKIFMSLDIGIAATDTQDFTQDILWRDMDSFIQQEFKVSPKIAYGKHFAKPGWNVKYQKSGQVICTMYPEAEGFSIMVVIPLSMVPLLEAMSDEIETGILNMIKTAIPLNDTLWLMIRVNSDIALKNVKQLMQLKEIVFGS